MSGFFGVAADHDCVSDLFYGTDYHSHLGTRRGGLEGGQRPAGGHLPGVRGLGLQGHDFHLYVGL